ncbi:Polysaccharide deacetylase [Jannaschia faecimaris]|uniref:Chitooligosaccharide deacetylase n=1 Tax=Jannaschia faecimaris TaxID=1244108 RepID=A0A1H3UAG3_9RHOB|nr:polysaccharide deacetylase family protein [Jannaschia faecimaris]SDZ59386.1 Polysaccharide deacetylase [Jannaschia faecimaris]
MHSNPRIPFQMSSDRAPLTGPGGKQLIVHIAMNIEYWPIERAMPRGIIPAPHGATPAPPDVPNFSWVEYGLRCGMPRILDMLDRKGLPCSALFNAQVADVYPTLMKTVVDAGWELVGHGWFQQSLKQADDEGDIIRRCLDRLEQAGGTRPRAWLGPGLGESEHTPDILKAEGIEFLHDWVLDDLPTWMKTKHGPLMALPYSFELNDVPVYAIQNGSTDEYLKRVAATLAMFERELTTQPRVMTLALHPHIIGVPHIAHQFEQALDMLQARDDTVFLTSSGIGDWYAAADPDGAVRVMEFGQ